MNQIYMVQGNKQASSMSFSKVGIMMNNRYLSMCDMDRPYQDPVETPNRPIYYLPEIK